MPSRHKPASLFFFNDTATTEIYTLSLHDALPIYPQAFDVRPLQNWISLARHLLRIQQRGEFDEPGVAGGLQALDQVREREAQPGDHHRPRLDAAHAIDALLGREPLQQRIDVDNLWTSDLAFD